MSDVNRAEASASAFNARAGDLTASDLELVLAARRAADVANEPKARLDGLKARRAKLVASLAFIDQDIAAAKKGTD